MISANRQIWADSLKGILILLVVLGHAIQGVYSENVESNHFWNVIYSFHMPAFFAISGYFVKLAGGGYKWLTKRVWQLLVPYLVWCFLKLLLIQEINLSSIIKIVTEPVSFWFLWVLFWVWLVFQLSLYLHQKSKAKFNYTSVVFALILIGMMAVFNTKIFGFHLIAYYFSFYALGYYMGQCNLFKISSRWSLVGLFAVWFILALGWSMHSLPTWMPTIPFVPTTMTQLAYRFITAFVAIIVMLNVSPLLLSGAGKEYALMSKLGFFSLGIYVTHYLLIWKLANCVYPAIITSNRSVAVVLVFIIALLISYAMVWFLSKNKYTSRFFLGK